MASILLKKLHLFQNFKTKSSFINFFLTFLQNWTPYTLFLFSLPYFDTQHVISKNIFLLHIVPIDIHKLHISGLVCKKNFLITGNNLNYFCNGGPKFCERGLTKFIGASATKSWEKSRSFRYGVSEDGKP